MDVELSRTVGTLSAYECDNEEHESVVEEASLVNTYDELPADIQELIEDIQDRPFRDSTPLQVQMQLRPADFAEGGLVAHAGCGEFCRNPLHPGPCRGWRQKEKTTHPNRARERARQAEAGKAAKKAAPPAKATGPGASAPVKAMPAKRGAKKTAPAAPPPPVPAVPDPPSAETVAAVARARDLLRQDPMPRVTPEGMNEAVFLDLLTVAGRRSNRDGSRGDRGAAQRQLESLARDMYQIDDTQSGLKTQVMSVEPSMDGKMMTVSLTIHDARGRQVGTSTRQVGPGAGSGSATVHPRAYHAYLQLTPNVQGGGFAERYNARAYQAYSELGVSSVDVHANIDVGGYTWATQGFDWSNRHDMMDIARRFQSMLGNRAFSDEDRAELDSLMARTTPEHYRAGTAPTPYEFAMIGRSRPVRMPADRWDRGQWLSSTPAERTALEARITAAGGRLIETWAGKTAMLGSSWHGTRPILRAARRGGPVAFRDGVPVSAAPPRKRARKAAKATAGLIAAAAPEPTEEEVWEERNEFLNAIDELALAYANAVAEQVPAIPQDANPTPEGETDYASNHHMVSAGPETTDAYLALADELFAEWGRDVEPPPLDEELEVE